MRPQILSALVLLSLSTACRGSESTAPSPPRAPTTPLEPLIARDVLFGDADHSGVKLSPDGTWISWRAPHRGVVNLWVAPIDEPTKARVVTNETVRPLRQYFWAHDERHIFYVQDKDGDEDFHLFRVNVSSDASEKVVDLTPIEGVRVNVYAASHRRPNQLMIGLNQRDKRFHDIYALDVFSGKRTLVLENPGLTNFEFDLDHNLIAATRPDRQGGEQILAYQPEAASKSGDPSKAWKPLVSIGLEDSLTTGGIAIDESGDGLYMWDSRGRNTQALVRVSIATGERSMIAQDPHLDASDLILHPRTRRPMAIAYTGLRTRWTPLAESMKPDFKKLAVLNDGELELVDADNSDSLWVVRYNRADGPGRYYLWNRKTQTATFLFVSHQALEGLPLAAMHDRQIQARDGLEMSSYLTLPPQSDVDGDGVPGQPQAMVLLVHGGPWSRDNWGYSPRHQLLANRGYAVLSINFRGSRGFGKDFLNAGNGEWGKKMQTDLLDGVEWAIRKRIARADKICIMGGSYGGYATLVGLTQTPETFACGIDVVGPSNIASLLAAIPPYWTARKAQLKKRVGDWETPEGAAKLKAVSPLTHADAVKRPLLIGQGANDPRVKIAESDQIVAALKRRSIPVSYLVFPDEGHGFRRQPNNLIFLAAVEAFLSHHLGGRFEPVTRESFKGSSVEVRDGVEGIPGFSAVLERSPSSKDSKNSKDSND